MSELKNATRQLRGWTVGAPELHVDRNLISIVFVTYLLSYRHLGHFVNP